MKFSEYINSPEYRKAKASSNAEATYGYAPQGAAAASGGTYNDGSYWYTTKTAQQEELPFGPSSEVEALQKQVAELQDTLAAAWEAITELQEWVDGKVD